MSDRLLIAGATVPIVCAIAALVLLQRTPGSRPTAALVARAHAQPEATPTSDRKPWLGVVVATNTAELAAIAEGRVESVYVRTGSRVRAGERLVQFDRGESTSSIGMASAQLDQRRSELLRSQARAQAAKDQLERLRAGANWLSKAELEAAAAEARMADAELQAARANVGVGRISVSRERLRANRQLLTAPFDGTVVALGVDPGDSVVAGQIVLRILSQGLQVNFAYPPQGLPNGAATEVSIQLAGSERAIRSKIFAVRPELDPSAELAFATAQLPAALPDRDRWLPGTPVEVTLAAAEARP
ncbi:MAG TPA: efflux RND transporter periplasmic adaptor subunit, partial [Polyangiales bacterium]|nr:efflux RND transporter periplasmic adaptor subunit [Polyangiales bacterium]